MTIVTLTTDFGEQDYYVPAFKGEILSSCPDVTLVDISNNIPSFEVNHAAYVLKNAFTHFPKGSIHVVRVYETSDSKPNIIICRFQGHFFIGPDNGVLSMVFESQHMRAMRLKPVMESGGAHTLFCNAIKAIIDGSDISEIAVPIEDIEKRLMLRPVIYENSIRGIVQHVDHYGNVITNIRKDELLPVVKNGRLNIILRRNDTIHVIHKNYSDVPQGEQIARFNSKGILEIAVNCGRADELLGLKKGDNIKIEY